VPSFIPLLPPILYALSPSVPVERMAPRLGLVPNFLPIRFTPGITRFAPDCRAGTMLYLQTAG